MNRKGILKRTPKQVAALVILIVMAMVSSFVEFPIIPGADFLKYDPSEIVALISALLFGPGTGVAVAFLAWLPRLVTDPLGAFMNICASLSVVITAGLWYKRDHTLKGAVLGAVVGAILAIGISIALNYLVMPVYTGCTTADVTASVLPALLPFNAIKVVINCTISLLVFRRLEHLLMGEPSLHDGDAQDQA